MRPDTEHRWDKLALFLLAALVVVVLGIMVVGVYWTKIVPEKGDVLLGGIATGLILFLRDLVNAVRSSWEEVTRGKTMDTLSQSQPTHDAAPPPQDAVEAAHQTAGAAVDKAEKIERKAKP